ncbi:hypothetical protein BHE74_00059068 [Ensete ventricosum]|nr:hypothetical protein BHE74_00059068 [Ensete ventricosum]
MEKLRDIAPRHPPPARNGRRKEGETWIQRRTTPARSTILHGSTAKIGWENGDRCDRPSMSRPGDELGPDPAVGGGAELRRGQLGAAQWAGEVQVVEPAFEALTVEDMAAGKAADAVPVGQAAEAHRALRPPDLALRRAGVVGEGPVGGEVVSEDDEAGESGSDGRLGVGVGGRGGEGEGEEAEEAGAKVGDGGCGRCEQEERDGVAGDVVEMVGEPHSTTTPDFPLMKGWMEDL